MGSGRVERRSDERVTMNQWHKIKIVRHGNRAVVSVDRTTAKMRRSLTPSTVLNVDDRVYLGGMDGRRERYSKWTVSALIFNTINCSYDNSSSTSSPATFIPHFTLDLIVYINVFRVRLEKNLGISAGYHGCLKGLVLNNERYDLLYPGKHVLREKNVGSCVDDPCRQRPCQNGGKCEFLGESYRCVCPQGFVGRRCQSKGKV